MTNWWGGTRAPYLSKKASRAHGPATESGLLESVRSPSTCNPTTALSDDWARHAVSDGLRTGQRYDAHVSVAP
jgi:hypothetical protein